MSPHRSLRQTLVRVGLAVLLLAWPMTGITVPLSPFALAAGVLLAYEGIVGPSVVWFLGLLVSAELVYGIGLGVLSLSFMITALVVVVIRRWVSITPLSQESGWSLGGFLKAALFAWACAVGMAILSVLIISLLYGAGATRRRIPAVLNSPVELVAAAVAELGILLVLRRIDVPFRRRITYGV